MFILHDFKSCKNDVRLPICSLSKFPIFNLLYPSLFIHTFFFPMNHLKVSFRLDNHTFPLKTQICDWKKSGRLPYTSRGLRKNLGCSHHHSVVTCRPYLALLVVPLIRNTSKKTERTLCIFSDIPPSPPYPHPLIKRSRL